jgi:hypothetical protein
MMMMRLLAIPIGMLVLLMPGSAISESSDHQKPITPHAELFGIRLGYPLDFPACNGGFTSSKGIFKNGLCRQRSTEVRPGEYQITLRFSDDARPTFIDPTALGTFNVIVFKGVVQGLAFTTDGLQGQTPILTMLLQALGQPHQVRRNVILNTDGSKFGEIDANWIVGTDHVNFVGATDVIERGYIDANTIDQRRRKERNERKDGEAKAHN